MGKSVHSCDLKKRNWAKSMCLHTTRINDHSGLPGCPLHFPRVKCLIGSRSLAAGQVVGVWRQIGLKHCAPSHNWWGRKINSTRCCAKCSRNTQRRPCRAPGMAVQGHQLWQGLEKASKDGSFGGRGLGSGTVTKFY